jgi:hypothetical protein
MIWQENSKLQGNKYSIVKVLAEGAFGTTYLALQRFAPLSKFSLYPSKPQ